MKLRVMTKFRPIKKNEVKYEDRLQQPSGPHHIIGFASPPTPTKVFNKCQAS